MDRRAIHKCSADRAIATLGHWRLRGRDHAGENRMYPDRLSDYEAATKARDWKAIATLNGCLFDTWGTKKEFAVLPNYLEEGEIVLALASGVVTQTSTSNASDGGANTWLVALTNERFLFLDHAMLTKSVDTQSVLLDRVQAVSASQGFLLGKIMVDLSARIITIDNCQKKDVAAMADIANKLLKSQTPKAHPNQAIAPAVSVDFVEQLMKLATLRDNGVLTEEEFSDAKKKILAQI